MPNSNLKDKLIKLGSEKPELRENIRPVLDKISAAPMDKTFLKDVETSGQLSKFLDRLLSERRPFYIHTDWKLNLDKTGWFLSCDAYSKVAVTEQEIDDWFKKNCPVGFDIKKNTETTNMTSWKLRLFSV